MQYDAINERASALGYRVSKKRGKRAWIVVRCPDGCTLRFRTYNEIAIFLTAEERYIDDKIGGPQIKSTKIGRSYKV